MTIGYLTTPLLGLVDTAVIGQLGIAAAIGGLAVGAVLVDIAFFTFNFLRSGTVGLTAQAYGANDELELKAILVRALVVAGLIGICLSLAASIILTFGLWIMAPGEATKQATRTYFEIRMFSAPFALANYALFGWFIGKGNTKTALALQIVLNGINIIFSIYLGLVLNWGIAGVATATVIGEIVGCLCGLAIASRLFRVGKNPQRAQIGNVKAVRLMMSMNLDIMIRSFCLLFAFAYFTAQSAKFGDTVLAANAILMHFFFVGGYFLDGLAVAAEQLVGRAIGAKDRAAFLRSVKLTILWSLVMAGLLTLIYLIVGSQIIDFITTSQPVRDSAKEYFLWAAFITVVGVMAFIMDGIYMGSTWSREMSITMVISLLGFVLFWQVASGFLRLDGLWLSLYAFLLLRGVSMSLLLPRNINRTFTHNS